MRRRHLSAVLFAVPVVANALTPVTHEQQFCNSSHVVQARVLHADVTPTLCGFGLATRPCCSGELVVTVTDVLGIRKAVASYPEDLGISTGKDVRLSVRRYLYPQKPTRATCAEDQSSLLRKEFLFSVHTNSGAWAEGMTQVSKPPYPAVIWPDRKWVEQVLRASDGSRCPERVK